MKKLLLLLLVLPSFCVAQETTTLRISPDYAMGGTASQVFDSVTYIPLETTKESLFGEIWKMEITDKYFIISDQNTNCILTFLKDGKYVGKIEGSKLGGTIMPGFTFNEQQELIGFKVSVAPKTVLWYNTSGELIKKTNLTNNSFSIAWLNDNSLLYSPIIRSNRKELKESIDYYVKVLKNEQVVYNMLPHVIQPYRPKLTTEVSRPNHFYNSGSTERVFIKENDYHIWFLSDTGVVKIYQLIFPSEISLPSNFGSENGPLQKGWIYFREHPKEIYGLRDVYFNDTYLFFETLSGQLSNKDEFLVYNKKNGHLLSLKRVSRDEKSYFLPLIADVGSMIGYRDNSLYTSISSLYMFQAKEATKSKQPDYSPVLQNYFSTQDRKSNPVIVRLKLKENL